MSRQCLKPAQGFSWYSGKMRPYVIRLLVKAVYRCRLRKIRFFCKIETLLKFIQSSVPISPSGMYMKNYT